MKEKVNCSISLSLPDNSFWPNGVILFTIENNGLEPIQFCFWQTPLESILTANCFIIQQNGQNAEYTGIVKKRSKPGPEHYISIPPAGKISQSCSILKFYQLQFNQAFSIQFKGSSINGLPNSEELFIEN